MCFSTRRIALVIFLAMFGLIGWRVASLERMPSRTPIAEVPVPPKPTAWIAAADGIEEWDGLLPGTDARLVLFRFAAGKFAWKEASGERKTVDAWAQALPAAAFVANGGYFNEDGSPSGFVFAGGKRVGTRQFDLKPSALLVLGAVPNIIHPKSADLAHPSFVDAVQSYPTLVEAGKAAVVSESGYGARRTFFGVDTAGRTYVGLVPENSVTLHELSAGLAKLPVAWTGALNLDGGPSSGAALRIGGIREDFPSLSTVGNVVYAVPVK